MLSGTLHVRASGATEDTFTAYAMAKLKLKRLTKEDIQTLIGYPSNLAYLVKRSRTCQVWKEHLSAAGVSVPPGVAVMADGYRAFLRENQLESTINSVLAEWRKGRHTLAAAGRRLRGAVGAGRWPDALAAEIQSAYRSLCRDAGGRVLDVAVRSSATAEDLPDASFAGQQETFLNVRGDAAVLEACRRGYASLFTDRAIAYRQEKGFDHRRVALSMGIQRMVRSDRAGAGILFTLHPETGFPRWIVLNAVWGLGETIVQGTVTPDEYLIFKSLLTEEGKIPIVGVHFLRTQ
jgi:pyruvate,water dikinase